MQKRSLSALVPLLVGCLLCGAIAQDSLWYAPVELAGDLPARLPRREVPYVVTADITVAPGAIVEIEPGTRICFRAFTGLLVHGTLLARGTELEPIAFTSENDGGRIADTSSVPAPYDWNGITIYENAEGTTLEYCVVAYSLVGINALTDQIVMRNCTFNKNGKGDIVVDGVAVRTDGEPYTNNFGVVRPVGTMDGAPERSSSRLRTGLRLAGGTIAVMGLAAGAWQTRQYRKSTNQLAVLSTPNDANLRDPDIINKWESAKSQRDQDRALMVLGYAVALLGPVTFSFSLAGK